MLTVPSIEIQKHDYNYTGQVVANMHVVFSRNMRANDFQIVMPFDRRYIYI